jgi:hypothetical protein
MKRIADVPSSPFISRACTILAHGEYADKLDGHRDRVSASDSAGLLTAGRRSLAQSKPRSDTASTVRDAGFEPVASSV